MKPELSKVLAAAERICHSETVLALANPYHVAHGENGGQFTSKDGGAGQSHPMMVEDADGNLVEWVRKPRHAESSSLNMGAHTFTLDERGFHTGVVKTPDGPVHVSLRGDPAGNAESITHVLDGLAGAGHGRLSTLHILTGDEARKSTKVKNAAALTRVQDDVASIAFLFDDAQVKSLGTSALAPSAKVNHLRHIALHELAHVHDATTAPEGKSGHSTRVPPVSAYAKTDRAEGYAEARAYFQVTKDSDLPPALVAAAAKLGWTKL